MLGARKACGNLSTSALRKPPGAAMVRADEHREKPMQRNLPWITAGLVAASLAGAVAAADMAGVVKDRQAHYKQIGKATKGIADSLKSGAPNVPIIQGYAKSIDALAPQIPSWFPAGSGPEAGVKTGAKAEIWTKSAEFKAAALGFATEARKFDQVASAGDAAAIQAEFPKLGLACKNCHDQFRQKE
jgi:cytochrome c556